MSVERIRRSDFTGKIIEPGTGAKVRVMFYDNSTPDHTADLTDAEVEELLGFAKCVQTRPKRRGGPQSRFNP